MTIKLFFKHLFTSIRRRPAQPFLLMFIISFAISVTILAFDFGEYLEEELIAESSVENGQADVKVTLTSLSDMRFMLVDEVREALPETDKVCGTYSIPVFYGGERNFYYGVATDFKVAEEIFGFSFCEAKEIPESSLSRAVIVSKDFAEKNGVKVGDEITLNALGSEREFVVYAVSQYDILNKYSIMFDMSGAVSILGENSFFVAFMGENFCPSSTLYIRTQNGFDETVATLSTILSDVSYTKVDPKANDILEFVDIVSYLVMLFSFTFAFAVIYSCFYILTEQRKDENALFFAAGAKPYMLNGLSMAEMFLYWIVGVAIGIGLSFPMASLLIGMGGYDYIAPSVHPKSVLLAAVFVLAAVEFSMIVFILTEEIKKRRVRKGVKARKRIPPKVANSVLLTMVGVGILITVLLPNGTAKSVVCLVTTVVLMLVVFYCGSGLFQFVSKKTSEKGLRKVTRKYALKNCSRIPNFGHSMSLLSLFMCVIFALLMLTSNLEGAKADMSGMITSDYLVLNATEGAVDAVKSTYGVDDVCLLTYDYGKDMDDYNTLLIAASDKKVFLDRLELDALPHGNEVVLCEPYAKKHGIKKGDTVYVRYGEDNIALTVSGFIKLNKFLYIIDAEYWNLSMDTIAVFGADGLEKDSLYGNLAESLLLENAVIAEPSSLFESAVNEFDCYLISIYLMIIFLVVFALAGIIDSIVSSYRSRREEFTCYMLAGMNKKNIGRMKLYEVGQMIGMGVVTFVIFALCTYLMIYEFGCVYGLNISYVFR